MERIQLISIAISVVLLLVIMHFIATRRLRIQYSLIWLITAVVLITFSLWRDMLHKLAGFAGICYPPSLIFLLGFLFSLSIILHFSMVVSNLFEMNKKLTQRLSIMSAKVDELNKRSKETF